MVPSSISHADADYLALIELALREPLVFKNFRGMKEYAHVVEHSYEEFLQLEEYLTNHSQLTQGEIKTIATIDYVGGPMTYPSKVTGRYTSAKALKVARLVSDVKKFLEGDVDGTSIIEIGSNAGFQYKAFADLFSIYYTGIDLQLVNKLAKKYLDELRGACQWTEHGVPTFIDYEGLSMVEMVSGDLFLSIYGISECCKELQLEYIKRFCKQCRLGFVLYNKTKGNDAMAAEEFALKLPEAVVHTRVEYEDSDSGSRLITWGKPWKR